MSSGQRATPPACLGTPGPDYVGETPRELSESPHALPLSLPTVNRWRVSVLLLHPCAAPGDMRVLKRGSPGDPCLQAPDWPRSVGPRSPPCLHRGLLLLNGDVLEMWALPNPACTPPSLHPKAVGQPRPRELCRSHHSLPCPPVGQRCPGSRAPRKPLSPPEPAPPPGPGQPRGHPANRLLSFLLPIAEQYEEEGECVAPGGPTQASP